MIDNNVVSDIIKDLSVEEKAALCGCALDFITRTNSKIEIKPLNLGAEFFLKESNLLAAGCTFDKEILFNLGKNSRAAAYRDGLMFNGAINLGVIREPMLKGAEKMLSEEPLAVYELALHFIEGAGGRVVASGILGGENKQSVRWIDKRALKEIYLRPFMRLAKNLGAVVLDGGTINGEQVFKCANFIRLLKKYLKDSALIINGLFTVSDKIESIRSGAGYETGDFGGNINAVAEAVKSGNLSQNELDEYLKRILLIYFETEKYLKEAKRPPLFTPYDLEKNLTERSIVLLKNDGLLPLDLSKNSVAAVGDITKTEAGKFYEDIGCNVNISGGGKIKVIFIECKNGKIPDEAFINFDKTLNEGVKTVVVLISKTAVELGRILDADTIFYVPEKFERTFYTLAKMMSGDISPSGKLPFTWAFSKQDYPSKCHSLAKKRSGFRYESVYNGYRYFESFSVPAAFSFGHGLSYGKSRISSYKITVTNDGFDVDFVAENVSGQAYRQTFFVFDTMCDRNVYGLKKRLIGFTGVHFKKDEIKNVHMSINNGDLAVYNRDNKSFFVVGGKHEILLSLSAADTLDSIEIKLPKSSKAYDSLDIKTVPSYYAEEGFYPRGIDIERVMETRLLATDNDDEKEYSLAGEKENERLLKQCNKRLCKLYKKQIEIDFSKFSAFQLNQFLKITE